jgi:hypothetical protein
MQRAQVPSLVPAAGDQSIAPTQELPAVVAENSNPAKSVSEAEGASTAIETGVTVQPPFAAQSRQLPLAESSAGATQVSAAEGTAAATKDDATNKKAKADPENLEQFIEYAYSRKGQRLTLKPKVEKQIAQNCRLDDAALSRLQNLSKADTLLAVPRQILLVSQEVIGLPGLRAALTSFVSNVMLCHPAFGEISVQGALRNLPEGLPPADATAKVAAFVPVPDAHAQPLKGTDLQELRHNAVQLFVTWLAVCRGLNSEELSSLLFQVIWQPAAKGLADDNARLRALTDIGQAAGVGLACQRFRQQAIEARAQQDLAQREASGLRDRLAVAETQLAKTTEQLKGVRGELGALRGSSAAEMEALRRQHSVDRTHLQHELEQLRGRLVKRLTDSVDMLEVGLSALRKDMPRVQVMVERAEHVVDALRAEVRELKQE